MRLRAVTIVLLTLFLAACGSGRKADTKLLENTLRLYASTVRWGDIERTLGFVDPAVLEANPPARLDLDRLKQLQVVGYREQPFQFVGELTVRQVVQIEYVNRHTQAARSAVDVQEWRFDPEARRWWLMSGLPKVGEGR